MIVMAILAVMAAVVFPSVTGTTTTSRVTGQSTDISAVGTGVDRFNADDTDGSAWPTEANLNADTVPGSTAWLAGKLPASSSGATGTGTSADPYIFNQNDIARIKWDSQATTTGGTKAFYPDYLKNKPDYTADTDTISLAFSVSSSTFKIRKAGSDVYVKLKNANTAGAAVLFTKWGLDKYGQVWVFVDAEAY